MKEQLAYLGPGGSFTEQAADYFIKTSREKTLWDKKSCSNIQEIFLTVKNSANITGIVPIENSCEGSVNQTLDLFSQNNDLYITAELTIPVRHNLMVRPGVKKNEITRIISHPQAIAQCYNFLNREFAGIEIFETSSTARAASMVSDAEQNWAAVGNDAAAACYGLNIINQQINDNPYNETRFVVFSKNRRQLQAGKKYKTSFILYLKHQPGSLLQALQEFAVRNINLCKIESRPTKTRMGEYLFFIDIEGHESDPEVKEAFLALNHSVQRIYLLGSYISLN